MPLTINAPWPHTGFGIISTINGWYVVPGWHPVPEGTPREQIEFTGEKPKPIHSLFANDQANDQANEWVVEGSKGAEYKVTLKNGRWDCTCPARQFRRGECKHIKAKKNEATELC